MIMSQPFLGSHRGTTFQGVIYMIKRRIFCFLMQNTFSFLTQTSRGQRRGRKGWIVIKKKKAEENKRMTRPLRLQRGAEEIGPNRAVSFSLMNLSSRPTHNLPPRLKEKKKKTRSTSYFAQYPCLFPCTLWKIRTFFLSARWSQAKKPTNEHPLWVAAQNSVHFFPPFLCCTYISMLCFWLWILHYSYMQTESM